MTLLVYKTIPPRQQFFPYHPERYPRTISNYCLWEEILVEPSNTNNIQNTATNIHDSREPQPQQGQKEQPILHFHSNLAPSTHVHDSSLETTPTTALTSLRLHCQVAPPYQDPTDIHSFTL